MRPTLQELATRRRVRTRSAFLSAKRKVSGAPVHWDTIRSVMLTASAERGAREFSAQDWIRLTHEGCSKTRIEYCENSKKNPRLTFELLKDTRRNINRP